MITVTANAFHEKLHIEGEEVILNGPPSALTGTVLIRNKDSETLFIRGLPLSPSARGNALRGMPEMLKFIASLQPGEEKIQRIRHQLPRNTAPGVYDGTITVGGMQKNLKLIVQPAIEIDLNPLNIQFSGFVPGVANTCQLFLANTGNLPFQIPEIKHATALDLDYMCRASSMAIREKGGEGFTAMMDQLTRNIHREMADWALVNLKESGCILGPGDSSLLNLSITLPKNADPKRDYSGNIRIWNKTLAYSIKSSEADSAEK